MSLFAAVCAYKAKAVGTLRSLEPYFRFGHRSPIEYPTMLTSSEPRSIVFLDYRSIPFGRQASK
jgi:hypothetical protein